MHMKAIRWRLVRLNNSVLKNVRKNLRQLISLAVKNEIKMLLEEGRRLREIRLNDEKKMDIKRVLDLQSFKDECKNQKKINNLEGAFGKSLLRCARSHFEMGFSNYNELENYFFNANMGWNPVSKEWICEECFEAEFQINKSTIK